MSTKKVHLYNMAWEALYSLCHQLGRPVTAGEFAKDMGIARSTAIRWLSEMAGEGAVEMTRTNVPQGFRITYRTVA